MFGRTQERAQAVADSVWTWVKNYGTPTAFAAGRLYSSAGGVILNAENLADKGYQLFTHDTHRAPYSVRIPTQLVSVISNVWVNLVTRIKPIYKHFGPPQSNFGFYAAPPGEPQNELTDEFHEAIENKNLFTGWTLPEFGKTENGILIFTKIMLYVSLVFMFGNTIFSGIKLYELCLQLFSASIDLSLGGLILEILVALFVATCNTASTLSRNMPSSMANTVRLIKRIKNGELTFTPELAATILVSILSLTANAMFGAYYGTIHTFDKFRKLMPFLKFFSESTFRSITLLSTFTSMWSELTGKLIPLEDLITKISYKLRDWNKESHSAPKDDDVSLPNWWLPIKILTLLVGGVDSTFAGLLCVNSVSFAMKDLFDADTDNAAWKAYIGSASICTSALVFAFTVEGINQTEMDIANDAKMAAIHAELNAVLIDNKHESSEQDEDDEEKFYDAVEAEPSSLPVTGSKRYGTFPFAQTQNPSFSPVNISADSDSDSDLFEECSDSGSDSDSLDRPYTY